MRNPLEHARDTFSAEPASVYAKSPQLRFDQKRLASLVGFAAFGLPVVLFVGALIYRTSDPSTKLIDHSISHFYYREIVLGDFFVGTLVFIGTLLLAFRGWNDNVARLASVAGVFAFGVALFPTAGWKLVGGTEIADRWISYVHYASAAGLFATLGYFCLFVFTLVEPNNQIRPGTPSRSKRVRNGIYVASGIVIFSMMAAIGVGNWLIESPWNERKLTFWCETVALFAFGVSWITVGRAMNSLLLDPRDKQDRETVKRREAAADKA